MSTAEKPRKIDAIGFIASTNSVVFKIFDHLEWDEIQKHQFTLQEKLNAYLEFFTSGQIYDGYLRRRVEIWLCQLILNMTCQ